MKGYYKGGFDVNMSKAEAGRILGVRYGDDVCVSILASFGTLV